MLTEKTGKNCTGCGACAAVCPKTAIRMEDTRDGYCMPVIDRELCISCGLCEKTCPELFPAALRAPAEVYAAAAVEDEVLKAAASGGVFTALAKAFLEAGGLVGGCVMDLENSEARVHHILASDEKDLARISGSKYAQSDTADCYREIGERLKEGRKILYGSMPCQSAGLIRYLDSKGISRDSLYVIDIACHGSNGQAVLNQYLAYLSSKHHGEITEYCFRDKERSCQYSPKFCVKKGRKEQWVKLTLNEEGYWYLFQRAKLNRDSCFSCRYSAPERCGDLTIGDYWGIEDAHPELLAENGGLLARRKGISFVTANTERGKELLVEYGRYLMLFTSTYKKVLVRGDSLKTPSPVPEDREQVLRLFRTGDFRKLAQYARQQQGAGYYKTILKENMKAENPFR